jgi:hypothetical protein
MFLWGHNNIVLLILDQIQTTIKNPILSLFLLSGLMMIYPQTVTLDWKNDLMIIDIAFPSGIFDVADTIWFSNNEHGGVPNRN